MLSENDPAKMLRICAEDPMWANHAEVSKSLLTRSADEIERLRTALAQAEAAQPAAWTLRETLEKRETTHRAYLWFTDPVNSAWVPLYAAPQPAEAAPSPAKRGPMTPREIDDHIGADEGDREAVEALVREVEAWHGITPNAVTECADNDSPWLVCKPCAAAGRCAKEQPTPEWLRNVCRFISDTLAEGTPSEKAVARTIMHMLPLDQHATPKDRP